MERKRGILHTLLLLLLILALAFLLSAAAVPSSRILKSVTEHLPIEDLSAQEREDLTVHGEELHQELGRLLVETTDYSDAGSNTKHDPKSPGAS
ncbi:hypothetical protein Ancab_033202 [Ancistrocladus abbreviatus]